MSGGFYSTLADAILLIHFVFVAFVVLGFALILSGLALGWRWVRNPAFRICHLLAIGVVVLQSWLGWLCPLTLWEGQLRSRAGEAHYAGSFIQHWLHQLLFFQAQPWVFTTIYTLFGAAVLATWLLGRHGKGQD
jgi:multisubunit Na+/H+ antiporter MnhB subunit